MFAEHSSILCGSKNEGKDKEVTEIWSESSSSLHRVLLLPSVDAEEVRKNPPSAVFNDGVLTVALPKVKEADKSSITIDLE